MENQGQGNITRFTTQDHVQPQTTVSSTPSDINQMPHYNPERMYPVLSIPRNQNPNRLWAIPIAGGLLKLIILLPQAFMMIFAFIILLVLGLVNSFSVLFTGKIMGIYRNWLLKYLILHAKIEFFLFGMTDKYPGFNFRPFEGLVFDVPLTQNSKRVFAIPFFGFLIRYTLLIPFLVFLTYVYNGANYMVYASSLSVLVKKYYPQSTHELATDGLRMLYGFILYLGGLSDVYPSFRVSENKLGLKIFFIALPLYIFIFNFLSSFMLGLFSLNSFGNPADTNVNSPYDNSSPDNINNLQNPYYNLPAEDLENEYFNNFDYGE